jgi:hypothetical protein
VVLGVVCCYVRSLEGMEMRVLAVERSDARIKNGERTARFGRWVWLRGGGDGEGFERISKKRLESRLDLKAESGEKFIWSK